jgi:hypothetical protein
MDGLAYRFNLREVPSKMPAQVCISDNATLIIDGFFYPQIIDAVRQAINPQFSSGAPIAGARIAACT